MKKIFIMYILVVTLLTGCSVREPVFDRLYPDTSNLEKAREKRAAEIKAEEKNTAFGHLLNSRTAPKEIKLTVKEPVLVPTTGEISFKVSELRAFALQYCWRPTLEECGHVKPINLHENNHDIVGQDIYVMTPFTVNKDTIVEMNIIKDGGMTPNPDRIEVYMLEKSGDLTPYKMENIDSFKVPYDTNTYYFVLKGIYERHIGGVSFYMLRINVR